MGAQRSVGSGRGQRKAGPGRARGVPALAAVLLFAPALAAEIRGGMADIPAGVLEMGADDGQPADGPVHRVRVSAFSIDRLETTNAEFDGFVEATGHRTDAERYGWGWHWSGRWRRVDGADWRHPRGPGSSIEGRRDHPVVQVSWNDARAYCRWRGKRLPTEAEWERAARGDGGRRYAWGNEPPRSGDTFRASYGTDACCAAGDHDGYVTTAPVGVFPRGATPEGVHDLTGNVWEWVEDNFHPEYYRYSPERDPVAKAPASKRVIRGGGWGNNPQGLRATLRHANPPHFTLSMVGIRCAM